MDRTELRLRCLELANANVGFAAAQERYLLQGVCQDAAEPKKTRFDEEKPDYREETFGPIHPFFNLTKSQRKVFERLLAGEVFSGHDSEIAHLERNGFIMNVVQCVVPDITRMEWDRFRAALKA